MEWMRQIRLLDWKRNEFGVWKWWNKEFIPFFFFFFLLTMLISFSGYLRRRGPLRRPRCAGCRPDGCTCSWRHSRPACYRRCKTVRAGCRRFAKAEAPAEMWTRFHRRERLRDLRSVRLWRRQGEMARIVMCKTRFERVSITISTRLPSEFNRNTFEFRSKLDSTYNINYREN